MKKLSFLLCFIFLTSALSAQLTLELKNWLKAGPHPLQMPVFSHVKNTEGNLYEKNDLLKNATLQFSRINPSEKTSIGVNGKSYQWENFSVPADSVLIAETDSDQLVLLAGYINTDRWSDPEISIHTDALCEIYVNNHLEKSKIKGGMGEVNFRVKLNAGKNCLFVKLLCTKKQTKFHAQYTLDKKCQGTKTSFDITPIRYCTINDVLEGEKIGSSLISPSGNFLIIQFNEIQKGTGSNVGGFTLKDLRTGNDMLKLRNQRISQLKWLPRTDRFSYNVTVDGMTSLYLYDVLHSQETLISGEIKDLLNYEWSPGEDFVVFSKQVKAPEPENLKRIYDNDDRMPDFRNRSCLHILYLNSGISVQLTSGNLSAMLHDIHPEGSKILFSNSRRDYSEVPFSKQNLYELDVKTLRLDTVWHDKLFGGRARYSPDGNRLLVEGPPQCFGKSGENVSKDRIPNVSDTQLYIFDLKTGKAEAITSRFDPSVNNSHWFAPNDIYLTVTEKDCQNLYHYDVPKKKFSKVNTGVDVLTAIDYAVSQPYAVFTGCSVTTPDKLFFLNLATGDRKEIWFPEGQRFGKIEFGKCEDWNFVNKNNTTIYGRIYYPPGFDKSKKYPVIVNFYGGTTPTSREFGGRYPRNVWAANGYLVYVLQPSGATGFGQDFSSLHVNGWGFDAIDDIIDGTKKFLAAHPEADAANVGCIGASYGGYTTMLLQTRTDIFKTAIAHAGISSISSYWGTGYWGYSYSSGATAYSYPWNRKDIYVENSPLYNADKFKNSILLLHGTADTNVPTGESLQFYAALKILGKQVEMVLVDGENHHILDYNKRLKWHYTIMSWFDKQLKDQPQQWDDLYPDKNY